MPPRSSLPSKPDLRQLKNQAKDLVKGHQAADPKAAERLRQGIFELADWSDAAIFQRKIALKDAQRIIACEYGFATWAELKGYVDSLKEIGGRAGNRGH